MEYYIPHLLLVAELESLAEHGIHYNMHFHHLPDVRKVIKEGLP
jgi:hypothetical protein